MHQFKPILRQDPPVTSELAKEHGLTAEEFERIHEILGRMPTYTELGIFSVMWSEHCSYKNSILMLKTLPREGGRLLVAAGEENAGLVDIGDGMAVAFKIESHNHPSAVEPYQGAATGVGGILRDIFSMGARPIAALNSLRFGTLEDPHTRYLFKRVVKGIGDYGNSFGVPTVAGEVYFEQCYARNPLVNAMAVGIVEHTGVAKAFAKGTGNSVMIVGSSTGRDGIHGATFASEEISEASEAKRPAVQVGDPFTEKLLLEATLEAIKTGCVVGVQDMGAAGITCSTSEMSAKGESGMIVDLAHVPLRESGMTAYEIMLSESQERMLFIVKKGHESDVNKIFDKWDLHAEVIGTVEHGRDLIVKVDGEVVANIPAETLVLGGGAPVYRRDAKEPEYLKETRSFDTASLKMPHDLTGELRRLLRHPSIASKRWVFEQYDSMVRTNSVVTSDGDAAIVRIKGSRKGLAVKTDCNGRYVYLNPRVGAQIAVAESARNVVCVGATPVAITNCLNFGNPYDPEVYWQFREAVIGIGEACRHFETPVTGGNVSFYNESPESAVYPTPVIGMLGILEDVEKAVSGRITNEGLEVLLLGPLSDDLGGSQYLTDRLGRPVGDCPLLDLNIERTVQQTVLEAIRAGFVAAAHDIADGGLAVALTEMLLSAPGLGISITLDLSPGMRMDGVLFGEAQSRILIAVAREHVEAIKALAKSKGTAVTKMGTVDATGEICVNGGVLRIRVEEARGIYEQAIPEMLKGEL
ncbi:MAG: phosphoribosylformylglycinamidine synthase subunit PurL [Bacteroidetes bacterium]|jgi:phosphoribosylformylglycinamidine synthase|nr:phosphoribosylformylglycinamidine synthase subunit PurL [Bacteroidota bacterium]